VGVVNPFHFYVAKHPAIKSILLRAHIRKKPEVFVRESSIVALFISFIFSFLIFVFLLTPMQRSPFHLFWILPILLFLLFRFMINRPVVYIRKQEKEIEKDVLFAGRFLLVKIESGTPFFQALDDASRSRGTCARYFRDIVDDVKLGTPIEDALEQAIETSPSDKFRRILWQIHNALRSGIDIGGSLRSILHRIAEEQIISIKEYGKRLNSLAMFYMLLGIVVPALGMTMFIILGSFLSIQVDRNMLLAALFLFFCFQFIFIALFQSIRPAVNL